MTLATAGAFPATQSTGVNSFATGTYTGDASGDFNVVLGFTPRYVKVFNETDAITWEWARGMAATKTFKTDSAVSVDTTSAIVPGSESLNSGPYLTFGGTTALNINAKLYIWIAFG